MSPDELTYVLIALIVAGLALGLLVAVALGVGRRDRSIPRHADRFTAAPPTAPGARVGQAAAAPTAPGASVGQAATASTAADRSPSAPARSAGLDLDRIETLDLPPPAGGVRAADAPRENGRRFALGDRLHEPGADASIAGFLALEPGRVPHEGPIPDPYLDPVTGLDTMLAWERTMAEENERYVRYRRPVSVVVVEIDGLNRLVDRFGAEPARRVLPAVGDAMRRLGRRTDRVAHAGGGRFLVLLPETDEVAAINYVERVRVACERWLESGAVALRLSIGWASPTAVGEMDTAVRTAEERMYAERRHASRQGMAGADPTD